MVKWIWPLLSLIVVGLIIAIATQSAAASPPATLVVAGYANSFVVGDEGSLWGWGDNQFDQLGNMSVATQLYPYRLPIDNIKAVASGPTYTLILKNDGTVWAWGSNSWGQLGDGTMMEHREPAQVRGLSHVKAIAAGYGHNLALLDDGTVWAWGRGFRGELGIGIMSPEDNISVTEPRKVNISNVIAIGCGSFHSVALKEDGTVWTWGAGADNNAIYAVPVQVQISDVAAISVGSQDTLVLKKDGTVWGWGWNVCYQLGTSTFDEFQVTPVQVTGLKDVAQVGAGTTFSIALKKDGTVWAWGENQRGMLGSGHYYGDNVITPIRVSNLADITTISAGDSHSLALKSDGTVWAWGNDFVGQIGPINSGLDSSNPASYYSVPVPRQIGIGTQVVAPTPVPLSSPTPSPTPRPTITLVPASVSASVKELWDRQYEGSIQYIADSDTGDLYAFSGNDIYCLRPDGSPKWNLTIPAAWSICNIGGAQVKPGGPSAITFEAPWPVFDAADGYLYVYGVPAAMANQGLHFPYYYDSINIGALNWSLFAISPTGEIAWTLRLPTTLTKVDDTVVHVAGDRVYVFHSYNETIVEQNGNIAYTIPDIASPAAVDERGNTYSVPAIRINRSSDYRISGSVLEARGSDGMLLWRKDLGEPIVQQYVVQEQRSKYGTLPIYQNGSLYVPVKEGIIVLDTAGNKKWSQFLNDGNGSTYRLFSLMPLDSLGRVYLTYDNPFDVERTQVYVVSPDGVSVSPPREYRNIYNILVHTAAKDGVLYQVSENVVERFDARNLNDLMTFTVTAYDLVYDRELWNFTLPVNAMYTAILNNDNIDSILGEFEASIYRQIQNPGAGMAGINNIPSIYLYPGNDMLLVNARSVNYETPLVMNKSRCVYSSGIYALDTRGALIYASPQDNPATAAIATNGTIFFGNSGGKIEAIAIGVVAGLALLASLALAVKFFLFGTVARARSRLDKNENRNLVLTYVRENPGSTLYEISRGMRMNMGTARYHVFILGVNHKIATFNDGKFVRYFPNSNFYSKEEQLIISLIRRETMGKIIQTLIVTPGLTNTELSKALEQPNSAISKLTKELCMRGIAVREELGDERADGKFAFSIKTEFFEKTADLSHRLKNE